MPAPPPPQPPLAGELEALGGRQIFIDDINESKAGLGLAYSPPFLLSDQRQLPGASFPSNGISDILLSSDHNSTNPWNASDFDEDDRSRFWPFAVDMQHLVFVAMCLCLVTLVMLIIVILKLRHIYVRWRRRRRGGPRIAIIEAQGMTSAQTPQCNNGRRGLLSRMLARIEEFDSLTPLIVTPNSLSDDDHAPIPAMANRNQSADRISTATNTTNTPVSFRGSPRRRPRCMGGKVTLFPLASNVRRAEPYLPAEVASDSGDSLRAPYPNNIHARVVSNGAVMKNPFEDLDLVSIDRTSGASTLDRLDRRGTPNDLLAATPAPGHDSNAAVLALSSRQHQSQHLFQHQSTLIGSSAADIYPLSTLPPSPASTDVLIPASELHSSAHNLNHVSAASNNNNKPPRSTNGNNHYRYVIKRESNSVDSLNSNLSSPMDSSICGDTGSPLDTTGSLAELSDSVYMASESENSEAAKNGSGRIYSVETGSSQRWYSVSGAGGSGSGNGDSDRSEPDLSTFEFETPALKRYVLHRIEEESVDDMAAAATTATSSATPADRSKRSAGSSKNGKKA